MSCTLPFQLATALHDKSLPIPPLQQQQLPLSIHWRSILLYSADVLRTYRAYWFELLRLWLAIRPILSRVLSLGPKKAFLKAQNWPKKMLALSTLVNFTSLDISKIQLMQKSELGKIKLSYTDEISWKIFSLKLFNQVADFLLDFEIDKRTWSGRWLQDKTDQRDTPRNF